MQYDQDTIYRFGFSKTWFATSGVMNQCEELQCYWVMDIITSYIPQLTNADYLKVITVELHEGSKCTFKIMDEISGELVVQEIEFTDLTENLKFWAITEGDKTTVLLPSEY